jgi:hypothetical protein
MVGENRRESPDVAGLLPQERRYAMRLYHGFLESELKKADS